MGNRHNLKVTAGVVLGLLLLGAAGTAAVRTLRHSEPVYVYGFRDGMAGQVGFSDLAESEGFVTAEGIQPVYLSDSQTVLEIKVREGERVRKGQVLFTYDTTLTSLALDQKRLSIERSQMDLESMKQELRRIQNYVPMPAAPAEPEKKGPDPYEALRKADLNQKNYFIYGGSGINPRMPKYCWLRSTEMVDRELLRKLCDGTSATYVVFQTTEGDRPDGELTGEFGMKLMKAPTAPQPEETRPAQPSLPASEPTDTEPVETAEPLPPTETVPEESQEPLLTEPVESVPVEPEESTEAESVAPSESMPEPPPAPAPVPTAPDIRCSFYDPKSVAEEERPELPENSGFTALEIREMRLEKQKQIKDQETAIHIAQSEYRVMELEASSGEVTAKTDGVVVNLLSAETARKEQKPLMRVTDGGGFYIRGTVSELNLDTVSPGQEMEIISPETGEIHQGTVVKVLEIPADREENSYDEDAGESRYPYQVFVDQEAGLREGMYVSMKPVGNAEEESLYVREMFLHKENGSTYVFVRSENGTLLKQELTLGPGRMDDSLQVQAGITEDDYLALPFEAGVKAGAATREGSWETMY